MNIQKKFEFTDFTKADTTIPRSENFTVSIPVRDKSIPAVKNESPVKSKVFKVSFNKAVFQKDDSLSHIWKSTVERKLADQNCRIVINNDLFNDVFSETEEIPTLYIDYASITKKRCSEKYFPVGSLPNNPIVLFYDIYEAVLHVKIISGANDVFSSANVFFTSIDLLHKDSIAPTISGNIIYDYNRSYKENPVRFVTGLRYTSNIENLFAAEKDRDEHIRKLISETAELSIKGIGL